jgi:hypothetical protein
MIEHFESLSIENETAIDDTIVAMEEDDVCEYESRISELFRIIAYTDNELQTIPSRLLDLEIFSRFYKIKQYFKYTRKMTETDWKGVFSKYMSLFRMGEPIVVQTSIVMPRVRTMTLDFHEEYMPMISDLYKTMRVQTRIFEVWKREAVSRRRRLKAPLD